MWRAIAGSCARSVYSSSVGEVSLAIAAYASRDVYSKACERLVRPPQKDRFGSYSGQPQDGSTRLASLPTMGRFGPCFPCREVALTETHPVGDWRPSILLPHRCELRCCIPAADGKSIKAAQNLVSQHPGGTERSFAFEELGYRVGGDFANISIAHRSAEPAKQNPSGGRFHFGMVGGFKSERWPASRRKTRPE